MGSNGCEANLQIDSTNCGACQRACVASGVCAAGACPITTYATGANLGGLAVDASFVYYVNQAIAGGIEKIPIGGGSPTLVYADNQATALAVDSGRIVWLHVNSLIESQLLTGGTVSALATLAAVQTLTTSSGYAYFTTGTNVGRVITDGSLAAVTITTAADAQSTVVDATNIYFVDNSGTILYAGIAQQNVSPSVFGTVGAFAVTADSATVYWLAFDGSVMSQPKGSNVAPTTLATGETITTNLVTDGSSLYWGASDGTVHRLPVNGGVSRKLTPNEGALRVVAVDATQVYWTSTTIVAATTK